MERGAMSTPKSKDRGRLDHPKSFADNEEMARYIRDWLQIKVSEADIERIIEFIGLYF
jgi:hypothetical protein